MTQLLTWGWVLWICGVHRGVGAIVFKNYSKRLVIFRFVEFNLSVQSQPTSLSNRPGCWRQPVLSVFLTQGRQTKESQARTQTAVLSTWILRRSATAVPPQVQNVSRVFVKEFTDIYSKIGYQLLSIPHG